MPARPRLGHDWALEDRIAPANVVTHLVVQLDTDGRPIANPAFDAAGRALSGNKARIDDALLRLFNAYQDHGPGWAAAEPDDARDLQVDAAGRALVRVTAANVVALRPALQAIGFEEVGSAPASLLIEGWLPVAALPAAEALAGQGLFGVLPILKPQTSAGAVTSQADWVMSADRVRAALPAAYTGAGVRIGVLSDSYNNLNGAAADVASGDLPAVQVVQDLASGGTDEGRAMLQLVHDVAPGSGLAFATAFGGETGFANNIRQLANPAVGNARVIVDDVFYFAEPYFQPGVVAQAIQEVYNTRGVTYFSSAGNQADNAWERLNPATAAGTAYSVTGTLYDFDPGAGTDFQQRVTIPNGGLARIGLQWDQPFYTTSGVTSDLDVFVFRADTGALVASSVANNPVDRTPWEFISYGNTTGQSAFDVVIQHFSGPAVSRVKYKFYNNISLNEFATGSPTISSHGGIPEAVAVAAVPYFDQRVRESFTSSGPMTILFDAAGNRLGAPIVAPGPVLAAPDGTNTTFFGSDAEGDGFRNFFGTSAAAPHAAAVAALVRQAFPGLTPAQVIERLVDSADPNTDAAGFDKYTGWGLIDAHRAIFGTTAAGAGGSVQETLESGVLGPQWEAYSTAAGRIQVTGGFAPLAGTRHVVLHNQFGEVAGATGPSNGRNELTLHVDPLAVGSTGILLFSEKEFSDDDHPMPLTFVGSGDFDGVAFSPDGNTWQRLVGLTGAASTNAYQTFGFNLPAAASAAGVTLTRDTRIRFQQYDNASAAGDGIALDNISFGVNQVPAFTKGADLTVVEDAPAQSLAWATGINPGPAALGLEAGQTTTFEVVSNSNPGLFGVAPAVGPTGTLTYTPAANANGFADIAVRIQDNGGTAGGGIDTSAAQTFRITVTAVNDAPTFIKGADETVLEDAGPQSVPNWATALSAGAPDEGGQTLAFQVVGNTNPTLFAAGPAISSSGTLTYTPAANASGSATITVALLDNGGGTNTSGPQSFNITVMAVNDVPSFTAGAGPTINEDAGPQSLSGWATAISAGPAESQVLTFDVSTNNDALFAALPAVSSTGTLTYTAAPHAFGSALVTVRLRDNGGTANGGVNASGPQTFALTVNPVNDAPTFNAGGNVTVIEDAGPQAVAEWATGISVGPANEGGQAPTFEIVSNNDPGLFVAGPTVSPVGTLRFTPAPNATGTATIQVRVRDGGGTANGGVEASAPQTVTIILMPVNDAPVANPDAPVSGTSGSILIDVLGNDSDVDGDPLTIQSFTQPAGGRVVQVGQQLQYTPKFRSLGLDPFTYTIVDGNGLTATATVTVDVRELNPPVVTGMRVGYGAGKSAAVPNRPAVFGWSTITSISVTFSEGVSAALDDLTVTGQAGPLPVTRFRYDPSTWTATWDLAQPLGTDRVIVRLDGSLNGVLGLGNNFPLVGGDFVRSFGVLWGDLDGNGLVTKAELAKVKKLVGKRYPSLAGADVDGDGVVTKKDVDLVKANVGKRV